MSELFLPGAFIVFDLGGPDGDVVDLTCLEDGQIRFQAADGGPELLTGVLADHIPVAARPGGGEWWRRTFAAAPQTADLADLAGIVLPMAPYRPGALSSTLELSGGESGSLFYALVLAALGRRLAGLETGVLARLAGFLERCQSPWAGVVSVLAARSRVVFRDDFIPGRNRGEGPDFRVKRQRDPGGPVTIDPGTALALLEGPVGSRLPGFQRRPQQEEMVRAVVDALNGDRCLLMEGATGTGKSLAYLVPVLLRAVRGGQRVLVATHTINLQEQVMRKDLPLLREAGLSFSAALVKGRQNYLCLLRWSDVLKEEATPVEAALFARVLVWSLTTATGDRAELGLEGEGAGAWARIQADSDGCPGPACPRWSECYVTLARQAAEGADLMVANHSLLFSDLLAGGRVLPEYGALVVDEAHHLEDGASEFLGRRLSLRGMLLLAGATERALSRLAQSPAMASSVWQPAVQRSRNNLAAGRKETVNFFDRLEKTIWPEEGEDRQSLRLYPGLLAGLDPECRQLAALWRDAAEGLAGLTMGLAEGGEVWAALAADLDRLVGQWRKAALDLNVIWGAALDNEVYWAQAGRSGCSLRSAPVEVAAVLHENLLAAERPVILTSATLTVDGRFDHFAERTGVALLPADRVARRRVESPFDYRRQALFAVATGLPGPGAGREYPQALSRAVLTLARAAGGRTMVLFTSHQSLRVTYSLLRTPLAAEGILLLGHGIDGSRSRLVQEFQVSRRAVLFGAASFWEGVDIPGDALSLVVIVKLPFSPPGDPVMEARLEALARRNLNGFARLSVPQAVIRFKQGFGRLIRSTEDRGAVVVLDGRLVTMRYGRQFLASLPGSLPVRQADLASCASSVAVWLGLEHRFASGVEK